MTKIYYKFTIALLLLLTASVNAREYIDLGVEIGALNHDLSGKTYLTTNLHIGGGYSFWDHYSIAFRIGGISTSENRTDDICNTLEDGDQSCITGDQVQRQSAEVSFLYTSILNSWTYFAEIGSALVASRYSPGVFTKNSSGISGNSHSGFIFDDDKTTKNIIGKLGIGVVLNKKHRLGLYTTSQYGGSSTGQFRQYSFDYSYIFLKPFTSIPNGIGNISSGIDTILNVLKPYDKLIKVYNHVPLIYLGKTLNYGRHGIRLRGSVLILQAVEAEYYYQVPNFPQMNLNVSCGVATFSGFMYAVGCDAGMSVNLSRDWLIKLGVGSYLVQPGVSSTGLNRYDIPVIGIGNNGKPWKN